MRMYKIVFAAALAAVLPASSLRAQIVAPKALPGNAVTGAVGTMGAVPLLRLSPLTGPNGLITPSLTGTLPSINTLSITPSVLPQVSVNAAASVKPGAASLNPGVFQQGTVHGASIFQGRDAAPTASGEAKGTAVREALKSISADPVNASPHFDGKTGHGGEVPAFGVDAARKWSDVTARTKPAVSQVAFAEGITAEQRALFTESMTRRKAGWFRELHRMGINLLGPVAPKLIVREASESTRGKPRVSFTVEWEQGPTHLGAFRATLAADDPKPALGRLPAPQPPAGMQLTIRFNKTVTDKEITEFLEARGLRVLNKNWKGGYTVAVTGKAPADAVAREISGQGIVHYATPVEIAVPESAQLRIAFKEARTDAEIGKLLRKKGLRVLGLDDHGLYRVGVEDGVSAPEAATRLAQESIVLYATPMTVEVPESRQLILQFEESSEDQIALLFRESGLTVIEDIGDRTFILGVPAGTTNETAAAALERNGIVKSAVAVGSATGKDVVAAANGAVSHKGRPWSATEYNMAYHYARLGLVMRGATRAQLEEFKRLCDEAPIRGGSFNPWSGD